MTDGSAVAGAGPAGASGSSVLLSAVGVTKTFGSTPALRGGDVLVGSGELVAVMGPSGSGKSTLLHCLAGILRPNAGFVEYDGRRVDLMDDVRRSELRRTEFGFVFQFGQLVPELTAAENVALPLMLNGIKRRPALAAAEDWMVKFGLEGMGARRPNQLSGGQAQRVAVCRAMVTGPRIIFADEPTGALDTAAGTSVLDAFSAAVRNAGVAVVLVTHEARVAAYADRTIIVRDGRIITPRSVQTMGIR